jgi:hypothetical protein
MANACWFTHSPLTVHVVRSQWCLIYSSPFAFPLSPSSTSLCSGS